jgi:hypothetical protein
MVILFVIISRARKILSFRKGLVTPVSFILILFSLTIVSTIAYNYSLIQIKHRGEDLKIIAIEDKMLDLEEAISDISWSSGAARTLVFANYGGTFKVDNSSNHLELNITMDETDYTLFDSNIGGFLYELPSINVINYGKWIKGDSRVIVNQSSSYQASMKIEPSREKQELKAHYRPLIVSSVGSLSDERRLNIIRIYIINLNTSEGIYTSGEFRIKVDCSDVNSHLYNYILDSSETYMTFTVNLAGKLGNLIVPLTIGEAGSIVRLEVLTNQISIRGVAI